MEKLYKTPIYIIAIICFLIFFIFPFTTLHFIRELSFEQTINISVVIALLFSFFTSSLIYLAMKNMEFWKSVDKLIDAVDKAEYKEDIKEILEGIYEETRKKSMGIQHTHELNRIFAIMQTKYKLLPSKL